MLNENRFLGTFRGHSTRTNMNGKEMAVLLLDTEGIGKQLSLKLNFI